MSTNCDKCGVANPADIHTCGAKSGPYASEAETRALLVPDTRTEAEKRLDQLIQAESVAEMCGVDYTQALYKAALKLAGQSAPAAPVVDCHATGVCVQSGLRAEMPAPARPVACFIGAKGSAFDLPETKRAYTYKEQPGNAVASKLGRACEAANKQRAGDNIDRGLGLLQELQKEGFGVFALGAEYTTSPSAAPVQNLSRLEPFVHGLGKAILRELMDTPPAAPVPLTDEQIKEAVRGAGLSFTAPDFKVARAIEAAHGITAAPKEGSTP